MRIAVTGGTGFIGKNLLREAAGSPDQYICFTRKESDLGDYIHAPNIEYVSTTFRHDEMKELLKGTDAVIHMIGQMGAYGVPLEQFEKVNCILTGEVVRACVEAGVRQFIYISTPGVQGLGRRACKENEPLAPRNPYEQTKAKAEQIVMSQLEQTGVHYTIIRPDFVYGPGDTRRIKMYRNIRSGKFILTTSGSSHLTPTYVLDVVQGINKAIGNPAAYDEIFNISSKTDITVKEYLNTIADYFGKKLLHINIGYKVSLFLAGLIEAFYDHILKKEAFVSKNKIDFLALDHSTSSEKAEKLLGYHAQYSFKEGFAETMKWCQQNKLI